MNFLTSIWIFQVFGIVMIAISESTVIKEPQSPITAFYGDTVFFNWTSNKSLDVVTWGIRSGNSASPQYIYVDSRGPVVKPTLDADLKRRIHYNGSLTAGRAWFSISHVNANDSKWYIGIIREQGSSTKYYYVRLIVGPPTTPSAPTTTYPAGSTNGSSSTNNCTSPCKNGGTCTRRLNDFSCTCLPDWSGKTCETKISGCASDPCKNGGTCIEDNDKVNGFNCKCASGWEGPTCTKEKCLSTGAIVGIVIGVLVGVGIIAVIGVVTYKKVKKDDKRFSIAALVGIIIGGIVASGIIVAIVVAIYDGCMKAGLLVGITLGVVVVVGIIAVIGVVIYIKKKEDQQSSKPEVALSSKLE